MTLRRLLGAAGVVAVAGVDVAAWYACGPLVALVVAWTLALVALGPALEAWTGGAAVTVAGRRRRGG